MMNKKKVQMMELTTVMIKEELPLALKTIKLQ